MKLLCGFELAAALLSPFLSSGLGNFRSLGPVVNGSGRVLVMQERVATLFPCGTSGLRGTKRMTTLTGTAEERLEVEHVFVGKVAAYRKIF